MRSNKKNLFVLVLFILSLTNESCNSQTNSDSTMQEACINRKIAVAGQFYPGKKEELYAYLENVFKNADSIRGNYKVRGIIVPHAGYVFSGEVAASGFAQIDREKEYKTIFIIGSSHKTMFGGASIYNLGDYETPLGIVKVDREIANKLIGGNTVFSYRPEADITEHSIEVQLPFLQYFLKKEFKIVPVIIGAQYKETCEKIAEELKPYFTEDNLFVVSTDFSHYPEYEDAVSIDQLTVEAIISNNPETLIKTLDDNDNKKIANLATSLCGWTSVLTFMNITRDNPEITYIPVLYKNSGDSKYYGDKSRVVGYNSIAITAKTNNNDDKTSKNKNNEDSFSLSEKEQKELLIISRKTLEEYVKNKKIPEIKESDLSSSLKVKCGAFVSLYKNGELRGCIGNFGNEISLYKIVQEMTLSSCSRDFRFSEVKVDELNDITIEISVLTPLKSIESTKEIVLGHHGIYMIKGNRSGTFLPQVATKTGWGLDEFLGHCAQDKAGIGWDGWKDKETRLYTYEAIIFKE